MTFSLESTQLFNFKDYEKDKIGFSQALGEAFHQQGFIRVSEHGIDEDLVQLAMKVNADFFALPNEVKDLYFRPQHVGVASYTRNFEVALDAIDTDKKEEVCYRLRLPKEDALAAQAKTLWDVPEVPLFNKVNAKLFKSFEQAARRFMGPFSLALGENEDFLVKLFRGHHSTMRMLSYPTKGTGGRHRDFNLFTLLLGGNAPGLWIEDAEGHIHWVTSKPGEMILNGGKALALLSNNYFAAMPHGVEAEAWRLSLVYFVHLRRSAMLSSVEKFVHVRPDKDPEFFPPRDENGHYEILTRDHNNKELGQVFTGGKKKAAPGLQL